MKLIKRMIQTSIQLVEFSTQHSPYIRITALISMKLKQIPETFGQQSVAPRDEQPTTQRSNQQEHNYQYYEQYRRLYHTAYLLSEQLKQLANNKEDIWTKVGRLEKRTEDFKDDIRGEAPERKKRFRRTAEEIDRPFQCEVEKCRKCYGSEGSLQQHIKLKHPELFEQKLHPKQVSQQMNGNDHNDHEFS